MDFIFRLHGDIRWLVVLIAVIAIIRFTLGLMGKVKYDKMDRILMSAYTGFLDLNFLLGLLIILFMGGLNRLRIEHAVTMLIAIGIAHASASWRKSDDTAKKFRNNLIVIIVSLLFILLGVIRLRGSFVF